MKDYKAIFEKVESTLISHSTLDADTIRERLEKFKHLEGRILSDSEYYQTLVHIVFYSGFRAATVSAKLEVIDGHFSDFERVAGYGNAEVERILSDPNMIRHKGKVQACIENARTFKSIVVKYGSFQGYVGSFEPNQSFENLMLLKEELQYRFKFLGSITTYHFLTDIGMPVIKPDRVVCRIFQRLGLIESIESEERLLKTVTQGRKFAQATEHPVRYVDIVFAAYGQVKSDEFGIERGICLEKNPACSICGVRSYCNYYREQAQALIHHGGQEWDESMAFQDTYRLSVHAVITNDEQQVLQIEATYDDGQWGLPGGSLEPGETVHEALVRECLEELGCEIEICYMSGVYYHRAYNSHACIFRCRLVTPPSDAEIRLSSEHSEYRYFALDELSPVQRQRVEDCLNFDGKVKSAAF